MQDDRAYDRYDKAVKALGLNSGEVNALRSVNPNVGNIIIVLADGTAQRFELNNKSWPKIKSLIDNKVGE